MTQRHLHILERPGFQYIAARASVAAGECRVFFQDALISGSIVNRPVLSSTIPVLTFKNICYILLTLTRGYPEKNNARKIIPRFISIRIRHLMLAPDKQSRISDRFILIKIQFSPRLSLPFAQFFFLDSRSGAPRSGSPPQPPGACRREPGRRNRPDRPRQKTRSAHAR